MQKGQDPLAFLADMVVKGLDFAQKDKTKGIYFLDI